MCLLVLKRMIARVSAAERGKKEEKGEEGNAEESCHAPHTPTGLIPRRRLMAVQSNLRTKDTLGTGLLSFIRRLSLSRRFNCVILKLCFNDNVDLKSHAYIIFMDPSLTSIKLVDSITASGLV